MRRRQHSHRLTTRARHKTSRSARRLPSFARTHAHTHHTCECDSFAFTSATLLRVQTRNLHTRPTKIHTRHKRRTREVIVAAVTTECVGRIIPSRGTPEGFVLRLSMANRERTVRKMER